MLRLITTVFAIAYIASCSNSPSSNRSTAITNTLHISPNNALQVAQHLFDATGQLGDVQYAFLDFIHEVRPPDYETNSQKACRAGGIAYYETSVANTASPLETENDFVYYQFENCDTSSYGTFTGIVTRTTTKTAPYNRDSRNFNLTFDDFEYVRGVYFSEEKRYDDVSVLFNGSFEISEDWQESGDGAFKFSVKDFQREGFDWDGDFTATYNFVLTGEFSETEQSYLKTLDGTISIEGLGQFSAETLEPIYQVSIGNFEYDFLSGNILVSGAGNSKLLLTAGGPENPTEFMFSVDEDGNDSYEFHRMIEVDQFF